MSETRPGWHHFHIDLTWVILDPFFSASPPYAALTRFKYIANQTSLDILGGGQLTLHGSHQYLRTILIKH